MNNTIATTTLRPGMLVSLKTKISGNVSYLKRDLDEERIGEAEKKSWQTERTIEDAKEFEAAKKARNSAMHEVRRICSVSEHGLLCPQERIEALNAAVLKARGIADAFNADERTKITRVTVNVVLGKIASDDVEAVRAINTEIRDLLDEMDRGIKKMDPKAIREAAAKARSLGAMLTPDAQVRVQFAIDAARKAATEIKKSGETAALEMDAIARKTIAESRTAFLDLDNAAPVQAPKAKAGRAVDLTPTAPINNTKAAKKAARIEVD